MLIITGGALFLSKFGMDTLSSIRAYVGGEGLYSKGQKDAVYYLRRYASSHDKNDYQKFLEFIKVPLGDKKFRLQIEKPDPDLDIAYQGYIEGRNSPEDFKGVLSLFRRFRKFEYIDKVISIWTEGDSLIAELQNLGAELHKVISSGEISQERIDQILNEVDIVNKKLLPLEDNFSYTLGETSRWAKRLLVQVIL